jgi:hypothetical protein
MGQPLYNGDRAWVGGDETVWRALVVDVSGHGRHADSIAQHLSEAAVFDSADSPRALLLVLDRVLTGTVGAAAMAVDVRWLDDTASLRYAGVGNVRLWVNSSRDSVVEGQPGLLGTRLPRHLHETSRALHHGDRLAIVTDGIRSEGRALLQQPLGPAHALATELVHRYSKIHDDATCVALQLWRPS